jgi:hypothetical protein
VLTPIYCAESSLSVQLTGPLAGPCDASCYVNADAPPHCSPLLQLLFGGVHQQRLQNGAWVWRTCARHRSSSSHDGIISEFPTGEAISATVATSGGDVLRPKPTMARAVAKEKYLREQAAPSY